MREFSVPAMYETPADANLTDLIFGNAQRTPHQVSFSRRLDGHWEDVTALDFLSEVTAVAKGLVASGVERGEAVGVAERVDAVAALEDVVAQPPVEGIVSAAAADAVIAAAAGEVIVSATAIDLRWERGERLWRRRRGHRAA